MKVPEAVSAATKVASKPTSKPGPSNNLYMNVNKSQSQPTKMKAPKPNSDVAKAKEALKIAQEAVQKANEEQKKAKADTKRLWESTKEPGVCNQIKVINTGANTGSEQPHPPCLSQLLQGEKSNTHLDKGRDA